MIASLFVGCINKGIGTLLTNIKDGFPLNFIEGFCIGIGVSGLLFFANALCVIFIEKKILVYLMLTLNIILYIFVFFEYVLDISGAFRELLVPTIFGVYGGVFLAMLEHKK